MRPRHTAEQSTVSINKREKMGRIGFGAVSTQSSANIVSPSLTEIKNMDDESQYKAIMAKVSAPRGPEDPQENFVCDSCQ